MCFRAQERHKAKDKTQRTKAMAEIKKGIDETLLDFNQFDYQASQTRAPIEVGPASAHVKPRAKLEVHSSCSPR